MSRLRQPTFRFWIGWLSLVSLVFSQANASTGGMRWSAGSDAADVSQNITTSYTYDAGNNRTGKTESRLWEGASWVYSHNSLNQLTGFTKTTLDGDGQTAGVETVSFGYDARGNRVSRSVGGTVTAAYHWDEENRLNAVAKDGLGWRYDYDYRTRRIGIVEGSGDPSGAGFQEGHFTVVVFSGGLSVAEYEGFSPEQTRMDASRPSVSYVRGPDLGGGVGGLVASLRVAPGSVTATPRYNVSNGRGDIVAQSDGQGQITWTASYEAFGQRPVETGTNPDRQRANSKEEDPTGLLNEGFRYRDLETGTWLSRDPAGFVDGPNLYAYVSQNPWTMFDPDGLYQEAGHYYTTYMVAVASGCSRSDAYNLAYHSQMPDETPELTAFESVFKTGAKILRGDKQLARNQQHLHSLTGGKGKGAVAERRAQLKGLVSSKGLSAEQRGLAIHAFGDSFAHTYTRGVPIQNDRSTSQDAVFGRPLGHAGAGHLPDLISARPELFNSYVDNLADALSKANGTKVNSAKLNAIKNLALTQAEENRHGLASPFRQGLVGRSETNAFESLANSQFGLADHMKKTGSTYDPSPNGKDTMSLDPGRPANFSKANEAMDLIENRTSKKK